VGDHACNEKDAYLHNTSTVKNNACVGTMTCYHNSDNIGPGQCIGDHVRENNQTDIP